MNKKTLAASNRLKIMPWLLAMLAIGGCTTYPGGGSLLGFGSDDGSSSVAKSRGQANAPQQTAAQGSTASATSKNAQPVCLNKGLGKTHASQSYLCRTLLAEGQNAAIGLNPEAPGNTGLSPKGMGSSREHKTVWAKIRHHMGLSPQTWRPRVQDQINFFTKHSTYLERVTARAEPYLYYITARLKEKHMPLGLALLPIVESAFIPYAYSSSNAAGLWQFTPQTARHFGLKLNWWYDGRRSIYASTNAALNYLQQLDQQLGSWYLALAAYNSGEGTVQWAIHYNQRHGLPTDFWHLRLPAQTQAYVPKLLAILSIVRDPQKYGVKLWPIPNKPYLTTVNLKSQIDLGLAAKLAGISLREMYLLNPGFNRWATAPSGHQVLLLPTENVSQFETALAKVPTSDRVTWIRYRVKPGNTLSGIAYAYRTTPGIIRRTNHLHNNLIRVGQFLIIPRSTRTYLAFSKEMRGVGGRAHGHIEKVAVTVKAGDTLWGIARRYRVTVAGLTRWNRINPANPLHPGMRLIVRHNSEQVALTHRHHSVVHARVATVRVKIEKGESLWTIAHKYGTSVSLLEHLNGIRRSTLLHIGETINVPRSKGGVQYAMRMSKTTPNHATEGSKKVIYYKVRQGDSLWTVAQRFGVEVADIRQWNHIQRGSYLHPGQKLRLRVDSTQSGNEA